jgi:hypothetical protein
VRDLEMVVRASGVEGERLRAQPALIADVLTDQAASELTFEGTHTGEFAGVCADRSERFPAVLRRVRHR